MAQAPDSDFIAHLLEMLEPLGGVSAKRMFGGHGFFRDGLMFGLVADGVFYLKVDQENAADFEEKGLPPFSYEKKDGKVFAMSYRQCPEEALESPLVMKRWAAAAFEAAMRAKQKSPKKPSRTPRNSKS